MVQTNPGSPFPENTHAAALFEAVALHPKAPLDRRVLAALLDALVACAPGAAVGALALAAATVSGTVAFVIGLVGGVPAAAWAGYYGFIKDGLGRGQTIGKKKMRLMVVHLQTNAPCSKSQS